MTACVEFGFRQLTDSKQQGKLGAHVGAPRAAQYLCMRKRGKPAGGSPRRSKGASGHLRSDVEIADVSRRSGFA